MGTKNVRYIVMVKPIHKVYGVPIPGVGRLNNMYKNVPKEDVETLYFVERKIVCGGSDCDKILHPLDLEPWCVFEVCYSIEECKKSVKKALDFYGEDYVKVFTDIPFDLEVQFS
ncbi:MAG: hypothetical protein N2043_02270 [Ignavibacterium sp.]|nr:hypothetical protein [Ignavibacterium sp.]